MFVLYKQNSLTKLRILGTMNLSRKNSTWTERVCWFSLEDSRENCTRMYELFWRTRHSSSTSHHVYMYVCTLHKIKITFTIRKNDDKNPKKKWRVNVTDDKKSPEPAPGHERLSVLFLQLGCAKNAVSVR